MFSVNDTVVCDDAGVAGNSLTVGKVYTVLRVDGDLVEVQDDGGVKRLFYARRFTLVTNVPRPNAALEKAFEDAKRANSAAVRTFDTGATRDLDANKLDFEGILSPIVLKAFAEYMHEKRKLPDGSMRDSDNWQLGIPKDAYMKSMWRHFFAVWESHRGNSGDLETELLALLFNVQGYLHETLKGKQ